MNAIWKLYIENNMKILFKKELGTGSTISMSDTNFCFHLSYFSHVECVRDRTVKILGLVFFPKIRI